MNNYYEILGLEKSCSQQDIMSAYKQKALIFHPDKNKQGGEKFKEITQAFQVLSNPEKRNNYDNSGVDADGSIIDLQEIVDDILEKNNEEIPNVIINLNATIQELYTGITKEINFIRFSPCNKCDELETEVNCVKCDGKGLILNTKKGGKLGFVINEKKCDICNGDGLNPDIIKCSTCNGNKYIKENVCCDVDIPCGAYDKYFITLENEGNWIPENERKNNNVRTKVIVVISETNNIPNIKRGMFIKELNRINKADMLINVSISFEEAVCGMKKNIELINNKKVGIEIKEFINNGDIFVIKNCGFPVLENENEFGDLFIMFDIIKPNLSIQQRKKMWQLITGTSYQEFEEINNIKELCSFEDYVSSFNQDN
jgi:DnaJ-class molecular chaperone